MGLKLRDIEYKVSQATIELIKKEDTIYMSIDIYAETNRTYNFIPVGKHIVANKSSILLTILVSSSFDESFIIILPL